MPNILKRTEVKYLHEWSAQSPLKPIVIRGARQVGKSTLVREFARTAHFSLVELNFERNPELREAFAFRDPARILSTLTLLTGQTIAAGTSLLFLDEIQAAPEALAALRYFHEEMPELHVAAAGSLMEFALADTRFSMPVGRVEYLHLGPMEFEDFLGAAGHPGLASHLRSFSPSDLSEGAISGPVHEKYVDLLRQYWVVGGLPEAVSAWAQSRDFMRVSRVHQSVVATYRDDFDKYSHGSLKGRIQTGVRQAARHGGTQVQVCPGQPGPSGRRAGRGATASVHGAGCLEGSSHLRQRPAPGGGGRRAPLQVPVHGCRSDVRRLASQRSRFGQTGPDPG